MEIVTTQSALVAAPAGLAFDAASDAASAGRIMRRHGPIPGVVSVQWTEPDADLRRGAKRRVRMTDGSVLSEEIVAVERPALYQCRLAGGLPRPFSLLVRSGVSTWRFEEAGGATRMRWQYAFELTSPIAWPAASFVLHVFFAGWMRRCLAAVRVEAEARRGAPAKPTGAGVSD